MGRSLKMARVVLGGVSSLAAEDVVAEMRRRAATNRKRDVKVLPNRTLIS
jgi:hypothetical protein